MKMPKQLDTTAGRLGLAMRHARQMYHMTSDDAAFLLRISPNELFEYERGVAPIPTDIMEHIVLMGYKMMRVRILERAYSRRRAIFRKIRQSDQSMPHEPVF